MAWRAASAWEASGPPAWARSGRPPPPLPPTAAEAARARVTASNRPVRSGEMPTTMLALPSAVETRATTPLPSLRWMASARFLSSRAGTSPRLRAARRMPLTSSTAAASPPVARRRWSSVIWRSSRRRSSISASRRAGSSRGGVFSVAAASASARSVSAMRWRAASPVVASMRRRPAPIAVSATMRKRPISPVRRTWVPPQSSIE